MNKKLFVLLFLSLTQVISSVPSVSASINVEEISTQKCFSEENAQTTKKANIYQIINNSTSNTIFIQYKSLTSLVISDSIKYSSSVIYKDSSNEGSYYLQVSPSTINYYITATKKDKDFQICFISFPKEGNEFKLSDKNKSNPNIKTATYNIISNSNLTYLINNCDFKQNKIFYTLRFEQKLLDKINIPKIQIGISFINSQREEEVFTIDKFYLQNEFYYVPFFIPKLNYTEKFSKIILCINLEVKQNLTKDELIKFDLDLVDSQEITCEYDINLNPKEDNDEILYPKVYYINLQKNIYEFDRDILLLKHDSENKYINPFFASNININNNNSFYIKKDFIDINKKSLLNNINSNNKNSTVDLLILILDECKKIKDDKDSNIFISFKFYGGYHDLMHYEEDITISKFFNEEKNKITIKMPNCRPQFLFNYFIQTNETLNDERILDIESPIGNMDLFYMNEIKGKNLDEYFDNLKQKCIHKFDNSFLNNNFGALELSCNDNKQVMSYIYGFKKNSKEDFITFMNQKALVYVELNSQYTFKFNEKDKEKQFNFRIKIIRSNLKGDEEFKLEINYDNQIFNLNKEDTSQYLTHSQNSDANLIIKSDSPNKDNTTDKGFIIEIFKAIDVLSENILYIDTETEKESDLTSNNIISFAYSKKEINSAYNKIELYNPNNDQTTKIQLCIYSGKGKYPYVSKPICNDEEEYIIINSGESFNLTYNNPYIDGIYNENEQFYVNIIADKNIKYSYSYEREIKLEENKYENLFHNGKKVLKLSNQKNNKKSMYYQINVCQIKNSNFYYTINNSDKILIENDIYQECSLEELKSFLVEFEGDGEQKAKFKYFYGPDKLLQTIEKFYKDISLSKGENDKGLLIEFQTPFVQQIEVKIIFVEGNEEKYNDFCSFEIFCKNNFDSDKLKLIEKKVISKDNRAIVNIDIKEIEELLNKDVDIYLIAKSLANNLEIFYDVKTLNLDLNKLDSGIIQNDENKKYICINCGGNGEQKEKENINLVEEKDENKDESKDENKDESKDENNEEKKEEKDEQKNNEVDQPLINQVPINIDNNNEKKDEESKQEGNNESKQEDNKENKQDDNKENKQDDNNESKEKDDDGSKVIRNNDGEDNENKKIFQGRENEYVRGKKGKDEGQNREDEKEGDVGNDIDKDNNDRDHDQDNEHEQGNDNNQNNGNLNGNNNNPNNSPNNNKNPLNNINNNTINENNNKIEGDEKNQTKSNVLIGGKTNVTKRKSRKLLYFILLVIIIAIVYCIRNQCYNSESVSYTKVSKYSYYDF